MRMKEQNYRNQEEEKCRKLMKNKNLSRKQEKERCIGSRKEKPENIFFPKKKE